MNKLFPIFRNGASSPYTNLHKTFVTSLDDVLDDMFTHSFPELSKELGQNFISKGSYPKVDITERPNFITIEAELNGLTKSDVSVNVVDDTLVIKGNKQSTTDTDQQKVYLKREIKRSSFERSFQLNPDVLDKNTVAATFENGSLFITIQKIKKVEPKPQVIEIKIQ